MSTTEQIDQGGRSEAEPVAVTPELLADVEAKAASAGVSGCFLAINPSVVLALVGRIRELERGALCPVCFGLPERPDIDGCAGCFECDFTGTREAYLVQQRLTAEGYAAAPAQERSEG